MQQTPPLVRWLPFATDTSLQNVKPPSHRHKLAACLHRGSVYVFGGASKTKAYRDLHRYELEEESWTQLKGSGDAPPALQGHTMLGYKNALYVFGGDFQYGGTVDDVSLWKYDILSNCWQKHVPYSSEVSVPPSRRSHSMVHYNGHLFIYGGYVDLKGSSSELWSYVLEGESWRLEYSTVTDEGGPGARHGHTAVVYDHAMWVCGGMTDLQPKQDMWRWNFGVRQWYKVKCKQSPPAELCDHTAVVVNSYMLVYGGVRTEQCSSVWLFHFDTLNWQKILCNGIPPKVRLQHCAVLVDYRSHSSQSSHRTKSEPQLPNQARVLQQRRPKSSPASVLLDRKVSSTFGSNRVLPIYDGLANGTKTQMLQSKHILNSLHGNTQCYRSDHYGKSENHISTSNTENPKKVVLNGIESYKEFAQELIIKDRLENRERRMYNRQSSANPDVELKMRQIKRINSRMSSSCESITQAYQPADTELLLRSRSKTLGNVSLNSQSGFDNPTFLNSSGNSSDLNNSRIRRISNGSNDYCYSTETLHYLMQNSDLPHSSKVCRIENSKIYKKSKLRGRRSQNRFNRSVSVDSILEAPYEVSTDVKLNTKHALSQGELLADISQPGSTDNLIDVPPTRCLKKADLIVEDFEDVEFDEAETSFSDLLGASAGTKSNSGVVNHVMEFEEFNEPSDFPYRRENNLPEETNDMNSYYHRSNFNANDNAASKMEMKWEHFGDSISAHDGAYSGGVNPFVSRSRKLCASSGVSFELQALAFSSQSNNSSRMQFQMQSQGLNQSVENSQLFKFSEEPRGLDTDFTEAHPTESKCNTNTRPVNGRVSKLSAAYTNQVYFDSISDGSGLVSGRSGFNCEKQNVYSNTRDRQQAHRNMADKLNSHEKKSRRTNYEVFEMGKPKMEQSKHYVMIVLGGKEQRDVGFTTKPLAVCHLDIQF